jgi:hypothetical protein
MRGIRGCVSARPYPNLTRSSGREVIPRSGCLPLLSRLGNSCPRSPRSDAFVRVVRSARTGSTKGRASSREPSCQRLRDVRHESGPPTVRECRLILRAAVACASRPTVFDVVFEIIKHPRALARQPEAERHGEQAAEDPTRLEDRVERNTGGVLVEGDDLPAIAGLPDEGGKSRPRVRERPAGLVVENDRLLDVGEHRQPGLADPPGDQRIRVADLWGDRPRRRNRRASLADAGELVTDDFGVGARLDDRRARQLHDEHGLRAGEELPSEVTRGDLKRAVAHGEGATPGVQDFDGRNRTCANRLLTALPLPL